MRFLAYPNYFKVYFNVPFHLKDEFKTNCKGRWCNTLKKWYIIYYFFDNCLNYIDLNEAILKDLVNSKPKAFNYKFSHVSWDEQTGYNNDDLTKLIENIFK